MNELFIFILFATSVEESTIPALLPLLYSFYFMFLFLLPLNFSYSHTITSHSIHLIQYGFFIVIVCLCLFQLPFFPPLNSMNTFWRAFLRVFGIDKFRSDLYDGRAMCLGDGVHIEKSQIVECHYFSSFSAMGYYSLLLIVLSLYVWQVILDNYRIWWWVVHHINRQWMNPRIQSSE